VKTGTEITLTAVTAAEITAILVASMATVQPRTQSEIAAGEASNRPTERLMSIDFYRGLAVMGMILVDNPGSDDQAYWPIKHAEWNGWTPADFIFPSFVFLVGISMVFSFAARLRRGESRQKILFHALIRTLILIVIGLLVNVSPLIGLDIHTWRVYGVTQRIALCYFAAAFLLLWTNRRTQAIALGACLVGYWVLMRFAPVPGFGVPGHDIPFMDPERNIVAWLDRKLFMGRLYNGMRDPEGLLSTIPAIGTILIGVLTGHWLRSEKSASTKALRMLCVGIPTLLAGLIWNRWFPINKNFMDEFVRTAHWRLRSDLSRLSVLGAGDQAVAGLLDDSDARLWNERNCRVRRRLARIWARLHLHGEKRKRSHDELA
jgi:predicted acyltransferase